MHASVGASQRNNSKAANSHLFEVREAVVLGALHHEDFVARVDGGQAAEGLGLREHRQRAHQNVVRLLGLKENCNQGEHTVREARQ